MGSKRKQKETTWIQMGSRRNQEESNSNQLDQNGVQKEPKGKIPMAKSEWENPRWMAVWLAGWLACWLPE
jgi:hypothetical protein